MLDFRLKVFSTVAKRLSFTKAYKSCTYRNQLLQNTLNN